MATYTKEQLEDMKVSELRSLAKELSHDALSGYSKMNKGDLVTALCTAMNVGAGPAPSPTPGGTKTRAPKKKPKDRKEPEIRTRTELKAELKTVQQRKSDALAAGNHRAVKAYRHRIRKLKRAIRAAAQ